MLDAHTNRKAKELFESFTGIINQYRSDTIADLTLAGTQIGFSDEQKRIITEHASTTLKKQFERAASPNDENETFEHSVAKALFDGVGKKASYLQFMPDEVDEAYACQNLADFKQILEDTIQNYPMIYGDKLPSSAEGVLNAYSDLLPEINGLIEYMEASEYQPNTDRGVEHITPITTQEWESVLAL